MEDYDKMLKRRALAFVLGIFLGLAGLFFIAHSVSANGIIDDNNGDINNDVFPLYPYYVIFLDEVRSSDPGNAWTGVIINSADYPPPIDYTVEYFENIYGLDFTNTYWLSFDSLADIETYCGVPLGAPGNRDTCLANTTGLNSYVPLNPPTGGNIFGEAGILGTSTTNLMASVISGVQTTTQPLWPLFAFVGVSLAFVIGLLLVQFIKRSIRQKSAGSEPTVIYPYLEDEKIDAMREFYSRDGGIDPELKKSIVRRNAKKDI